MTALTCKELVDLITDYLEGALPDDARARFEQHLADCHLCEAYMQQMRYTIDLTGKLTESNFAPPAREELLGLFRDWKKGQQ